MPRLLVLIAGLAPWLSVSAVRGDDARPRQSAGKPTFAVALPSFTPQRAAAAMSFARAHHPDLAELLANMQNQKPQAYQRAIRELFRTSERLAQIKERRDKERYKIELDTWKVDSRIRLLAARLSMSADDVSMHDQLRGLLKEKNQVQLLRLQLDKRRAEERLKKVNELIERLEKDPEKQVERSLKRLLQTVKGRAANDRRPKRKRDTNVTKKEK